MRGVIVFCLGLISTMYLLNIDANFIELIPGNIPLLFNLDEAGAVTLLILCLSFFGIDLTNIFKTKNEKKTIEKM